jgi:hypothetical protein
MPTFTNTSTGRTGTIQSWVVPETGNYSIEAWGAQGGSTPYGQAGGSGARMFGHFLLTAGETIKILVGQAGTGGLLTQGNNHSGGGGGGGTFVTRTPHNTTGSILVIAGGGGGSYYYVSTPSYGSGGTTGQSGLAGAGGYSGGTNGGAGASSNSGASSGFSGNGTYSSFAYINGGLGGLMQTNWGNTNIHGGFGGGAGAGLPSGGGGGYSGGGGGAWSTDGGGGGGGSYNSGTNQSNTSAVRTGHGQVVITFLNEPPVTAVTAPADNTSVPLTAGVDFTYTYTDADTDPQTGYEFKRRPVSFTNNELVYGAEEWWDGTSWVGSATTVASTVQPISISDWSADFDTYQYAIATDDGVTLGDYTAWRTLNPYEWWSGTAWTPMVESWVPTSEDQFTVPEGAVAMDGDSYEWAAATRDTVNLTGPYSGFATFTVSEGVKLYDGTDWADYAIRIYNGSSWGNYRTRIYNGTEWVDH